MELILFLYSGSNIVCTIVFQASRIKNSVIVPGFISFRINTNIFAFLYFIWNFEHFNEISKFYIDFNKPLK